MARKTFDLETLVDLANAMLASEHTTAEERRGAMTLLETVLHGAGRYRGYRYLTTADLPAGQVPGVLTDDIGRILEYPDRFNGADDTRRQYS